MFDWVLSTHLYLLTTCFILLLVNETKDGEEPYSPGSVVGSRRNFRFESKIELNLLERLLVRKKITWVDIPDRLQFSLSSVFQTDWFLLWVSGQWKISVTKYGLTINHWLGNLMQNNFYKRSECWKSVFSKLFWNARAEHATSILMHIISKYMNVNIVCLKVCELFLYIKRVRHSMFIQLRVMVLISAEKPNLHYTWVYNLD